MRSSPVSFDQQASTFDGRTGLSDVVARKVAESVVHQAELSQTSRIIEIGAGTGEIGIHLMRLCDHYVGLDSSNKMLDVFRQRTDLDNPPSILCADANAAWPSDSRSVHAVFGSRVFHLLDGDHVAREVLRIAHPDGAAFLIGRVQRDPESVKSTMRSKMRDLLVEQGLQPRQKGRHLKHLMRDLSQHGSMLEPVIAARWNVVSSPADSINGWLGKSTMGGIEPTPADKQIIVKKLRTFAESHFGGLDTPVRSMEQYIVEGVRLAAT